MMLNLIPQLFEINSLKLKKKIYPQAPYYKDDMSKFVPKYSLFMGAPTIQ